MPAGLIKNQQKSKRCPGSVRAARGPSPSPSASAREGGRGQYVALLKVERNRRPMRRTENRPITGATDSRLSAYGAATSGFFRFTLSTRADFPRSTRARHGASDGGRFFGPQKSAKVSTTMTARTPYRVMGNDAIAASAVIASKAKTMGDSLLHLRAPPMAWRVKNWAFWSIAAWGELKTRELTIVTPVSVESPFLGR